MCGECGCPNPLTDPAPSPSPHATGRLIRVEESLLSQNNRYAERNRALFREASLLALNLVSAPGSGKTSLLERTLRDLGPSLRFAVLEGDQQTSNDAVRVAATGAPVRQINTGAGCHLDAHMVGHGLSAFDLDGTDVLMIENVGNLVCPASFDLGEDHKIAILSVPEGEDKPLKYPDTFRAADLVLLTKTDLLPFLRFDMRACRQYLRQVHPEIEILELSAQTGQGLNAWYAWLQDQVIRKRGERGEPSSPVSRTERG